MTSSYSPRDAATYLAGGDGERHDAMPRIGIAGPFEDGSLSMRVYDDDHTGDVLAEFRITVTEVPR